MRKLLLRNRDHMGSVWIDVRLSDANTPFDELKSVPGFPLELGIEEIVEIEVADLPELVYWRSRPGDRRILWSIFRSICLCGGR